MEIRAAVRDEVSAKSPARATSTSRSRRASASSGQASAKTPTRPSWSKWLLDTAAAPGWRSNASRYANAISAERSAANRDGLPMPGQCDRQSKVPAAGEPSTTTLGLPRSARSP